MAPHRPFRKHVWITSKGSWTWIDCSINEQFELIPVRLKQSVPLKTTRTPENVDRVLWKRGKIKSPDGVHVNALWLSNCIAILILQEELKLSSHMLALVQNSLSSFTKSAMWSFFEYLPDNSVVFLGLVSSVKIRQQIKHAIVEWKQLTTHSHTHHYKGPVHAITRIDTEMPDKVNYIFDLQ